jgi:hypothetical protein
MALASAFTRFDAAYTRFTFTRHELATGCTAPFASACVTSASTVAKSDTSVNADQLWFELTTAAFYHRDRLTWFVSLHRGSMFANVFFGTGAVASLLQTRHALVVVASLLLALVSAAALALDFAGSARKHEDRRRTYHDLAAQLQESAQDETAVRTIRAKMIRASADDPHVYKAAEAVAFNLAIGSLGRDPLDEFVLTTCQRWSRNFVTFSATTFPKRRNLGATGDVGRR